MADAATDQAEQRFRDFLTFIATLPTDRQDDMTVRLVNHLVHQRKEKGERLKQEADAASRAAANLQRMVCAGVER